MDERIFDKRMLYLNIDEFFVKKNMIKELLFDLTMKEQYIYKLYVYAKPFISDTWKDIIWDYIQGDITEIEISLAYGSYRRKHRK